VEVEGVVQPAPAPRFSRTPAAIRSAAPVPGADFESVLAEAGYSAQEIRTMVADRLVVPPKR
jgi:alpha-methylacyl-CoA racemase